MNSPELEDKIQTIELRLTRIEKVLNRLNVLNLGSSAYDRPEYTDEDIARSETSDNQYSTLITKVQSNWLGFIAVICFVLAGGFIIKLSIDSGWLSCEKRIGLSTLFGIGLIFSRSAFLTLSKGGLYY